MTFGPSYCRKWDWNFKFYKHQWESRCFFIRFFFSNQEAKLFIIVRQPLTPLPEEKPVLNHFQCHTVFVCLFVFLSRSVSETNHSDDRLFSWGLPKGTKKKALRYESGMTQVLPLLPGPRHQRKRCERWYCKRIAMNTFYPWVTAHAVRWWTYSMLTECFR